MINYIVTIHFKSCADYETEVCARSEAHAKVRSIIEAAGNGFNGDLAKQPTVICS